MTAQDNTVKTEGGADNFFGLVGVQPEAGIVIHTMPKKFIGTGGAQQAKKIGLLILLGGATFLIAAFAFAYFYFIKPSQPAAEVKTETPIVAETDKTAVKTETPIVAVAKPAEPIIASSTNQEIVASSTVNEIGSLNNNLNNIATSTTEQGMDTTTATTASATAIQPDMDSDQDGLTDTEEKLLLTTIDKKDSDSDGYEDLAELLSLFNPAGAGKIIVNPNIEKYINNKNNYSLYYPKNWTINTSFGDDSIFFQAADKEFIQVIVQNNIGGATLEDWYKEQFDISTVNNSQKIYKPGWSGIMSEDGLNFYLTKTGSDKIFTIAYNLGLNNVLHYKNIAMLMVNSLTVGD